MKAKFLIIIEKGENNYSAYSPDVPECAATGESVESTLQHIRNALEFHFEGMLQNGDEIPEPKSLSYYLQKPTKSQARTFLHILTWKFPN
jgi:predicted RNase H-like HicB family nuclease